MLLYLVHYSSHSMYHEITTYVQLKETLPIKTVEIKDKRNNFSKIFQALKLKKADR